MKKLLLAMALAAAMMFAVRDATAGAWCEGVLTDSDDEGSDPDPGSGACTKATASRGGHPDAVTGCESLASPVTDITGFGTGCSAVAGGGGGCIGGSVGPAGVIGCLCVADTCMCSTGGPLAPAIPCDAGLCRASAQLGCS